MCLTALLLNTD